MRSRLMIKYDNHRREVYATHPDRLPFLSPDFVVSKLDACNMLKLDRINGLIDYGAVDIAALLRARKRISLAVVVSPVPAIEAKAGELLRAYPKRLKLIPFEAFNMHRLINDPGQTFYDFAISIIEPKFRQDFYPRLKIGGLLINANSLDGDSPHVLVKKRWVIVTGCTRGATTYIWRVLRAVGVGLAHDRYYYAGMVGGLATLALHPPDTVILHQVRDPVKTIRSLICAPAKLKKICWYAKPYFDWQWDDNRLLFAMRYWYEWNKLGEERAMYTYRVEALEDNWQEIKRLTGIPADREIKYFSHRSNTFHGVTYPDLTWDDLYAEDSELAQKIADLAIHFGYRTD